MIPAELVVRTTSQSNAPKNGLERVGDVKLQSKISIKLCLIYIALL